MSGRNPTPSEDDPDRDHLDGRTGDPAAACGESDRDESADCQPDDIDFGGPSEDDAGETRPAWDANDARRQKDCFAPPQVPCECYCLHCHRTFMSDGIWFQRIVGDPQGMEGFWMCPTPNCDGAGFTFDIFPTDPGHPANEGWGHDPADDLDGEGDEEEDFEAAFDAESGVASDAPDGAETPWDADESKYKELDEIFGDVPNDDIEGEEWKYGLAPGERPPEPDWAESARRQREEEERRYDEPDERPRILDWTHRNDERKHFGDDDIPF